MITYSLAYLFTGSGVFLLLYVLAAVLNFSRLFERGIVYVVCLPLQKRSILARVLFLLTANSNYNAGLRDSPFAAFADLPPPPDPPLPSVAAAAAAATTAADAASNSGQRGPNDPPSPTIYHVMRSISISWDSCRNYFVLRCLHDDDDDP